MRAALNRAFEDDKSLTPSAWRKVKPFKSVDKARVRYLTMAEAKRLIRTPAILNSARWCRPRSRPAGRYSQLAALTVADFDPDAGTLRG